MVRPPVFRQEPRQGQGRSFPRPRTVQGRGELIYDRTYHRAPGTWGDGSRITWRAQERHPDHRGVFRSALILGDIGTQTRTEIHPNRYYWHERDGIRYSHYYDSTWHWYGFYVSNSYYWTRWHGGYFWWHDTSRDRWCYWNNDRWWWHDPSNVRLVYVHSDEGYQRYEETPGNIVLQPESPAPTPGAPAQPAQKAYYSKDGSRLVQVVGERNEAFLYDATQTAADGGPLFLAYLGAGVTEGRFSGEGEAGLRVLVLFADGTFALFDGAGNPAGAAATEGVEGVEVPEGALQEGAPAAAQGLERAGQSPGGFGTVW